VTEIHHFPDSRIADTFNQLAVGKALKLHIAGEAQVRAIEPRQLGKEMLESADSCDELSTLKFIGRSAQHSFGDAAYRLRGQSAVIVAQAVRGASNVQLSRSGRSEKGVSIAGGRLGELFHRDVADARVDPQLGAGDAALEPMRVR
jgi:hypothetical protein